MKRSVLMLTGLSALALFSCNKAQEVAVPEQEGREIRLSSSIGAYTKATDNRFETGDLAGLSITAPVNVSNVKLTYSDGGLVPERTLYWPVDQKDSEKSTFVAYAPYRADMDPLKPFPLFIPSDQSEEGVYAASDLLYAVTEASPSDGTVHLGFSHALSRLVLSVENRIAGKSVSAVAVDGVRLSVEADLRGGTFTATGDPAQVTPALRDGRYVFLVAPQQVKPEVWITLSSGEQVRYVPESELVFSSGKQIAATITVEEEAVSFTAEVFDWLDESVWLGKEVDSSAEAAWYLEGNFGDDGSWQQIAMEETSEGVFQARASCPDGAYFLIANDRNSTTYGPAVWNYEYTCDAEPVTIPLRPYDYRAIVLLGTRDILDFTFIPEKMQITVQVAPHQWQTLGTGRFVDGFIADSIYGFPHEEIDVEMEEDALRPGLYRIGNPYAHSSYRSDRYIDYQEGGELLLDARDLEKVYFKESWTGLSDTEYGNINAFSLVGENGWGRGYYGTFNSDQQVFYFDNLTATRFIGEDGIRTTYSNRNGMMSVTLPGGERRNYYLDTEIGFTGTEVADDGTNYAVFSVKPGMDAKGFRYGIYSGQVDRATIVSTCVPAVRDKADGTVVVEGYVPDQAMTLKVPFTQTGSYTILFYADGPEDYYYWRFFHYAVVAGGDETPALSLSVTNRLHPYYPESAGFCHVDMKAPVDLYTLVVTSDVYEGIAQDDLYDYILSNGTWRDTYYFNDQTGMDYPVTGRTPDTEYYTLVAGTDQYSQSGFVVGRLHTAATPTWSYLGIGHFNDKTWMFGGSYRTEVPVYKTNEIENRYCFLDPYTAYWEADNHAELSTYAGSSASSVDFYVEDDAFVYNSFQNGYYWPDYGPAYVEYNTLGYNVQLAEGVYNFAPTIWISDANVYYVGFRHIWGQIYLEMPGYTYTPESQTTAQAQVRTAPGSLVTEVKTESGMEVQTELRPFTRHLFRTGAPVVVPAPRERQVEMEEIVK